LFEWFSKEQKNKRGKKKSGALEFSLELEMPVIEKMKLFNTGECVCVNLNNNKNVSQHDDDGLIADGTTVSNSALKSWN
jgi:hypothetical protein